VILAAISDCLVGEDLLVNFCVQESRAKDLKSKSVKNHDMKKKACVCLVLCTCARLAFVGARV